MNFKNKFFFSTLFECLLLFFLAGIVFYFSAKYDFLEVLFEFSQTHEDLELDEIIVVSLYLSGALFFLLIRKIRALNDVQKKLRLKNEKLEEALSEIKQLQGIIPICSSCKKIRNDKGSWLEIETYVQKHSEATFSHGICPSCIEKLYPEIKGDLIQEN